jgi:hypothetical protein
VGCVTDWLTLSHDVASQYQLHGPMHERLEAGRWIVFTAIEIAEKRGRHWVRLPWCCKLRVSDVREVENAHSFVPLSEKETRENSKNEQTYLFPVPPRRIKGMDKRLVPPQAHSTTLFPLWDEIANTGRTTVLLEFKTCCRTYQNSLKMSKDGLRQLESGIRAGP